MRREFHHQKHKRTERSIVGFLCLLGGASVATMPCSVESFQVFEFAPSSSTSKESFANRHQDAMPTIIHGRDWSRRQRVRHYQSSILTSASTSSTCLLAHYLTTALEGLWEDRITGSGSDEMDDYRCLSWLDLESDWEVNHDNGDGDGSSSATSSTNIRSSTPSTIFIDSEHQQNKREDTTITLPLYPLSEVYLPMSTTVVTTPDTIVNHTLNNVEPQNIKMALDLLSDTSPSPCFCVVLRAMDTGRIATVGNILRIVDADVQKIPGAAISIDNSVSDTNDGEEGNNDKIVRIRLTCQSQGLAEILGIENGSGWREKRLLRSDEYLRARLRPMVSLDDQGNESDDIDGRRDWKEAYKMILDDLRIIKLIYQIQLGSEDYPPDTLMRLGNAIQDFPDLVAGIDEGNGDGDVLLWNLAQEWQSICMTLRQGRQAILATERNERMVAAACAGGGPLKLPIHVSDLDPESRREIQNLDQEFQEDHEAFGMDPILDFQVLLELHSTNRRFGFLAKLVARERQRLEDIASSLSSRRRRLRD